jgi:hypothetical protein
MEQGGENLPETQGIVRAKVAADAERRRSARSVWTRVATPGRYVTPDAWLGHAAVAAL